MKESGLLQSDVLRTKEGRCLILWSITGILLIIALFSGFGEPILPYIVEQKIDEMAKPKDQQSIYDAWYEGEKAIAKLQGRKWQDPREKKQPSLLGSWKWWIAFGISFCVSFIYSSMIITGRAGRKTKRVLIEIKEKIKKLIAVRKRRKKFAKKIAVAQSDNPSFGKLFFSDILAQSAWAAISKVLTKLRKILRR